MSSSFAAPEGSPESVSKATVAGSLHTIVLLGIVAGWAALGYFRFGGTHVAAHPQRAGRYALTMLLEWSLVGYIAWGTSRRGISLKKLVGGKWDTAKDVFRDIAISLGFWMVALAVLASVALAIHAKGAGESVRGLLPQTHLEVVLWILTSLTAGICEEIIFRGYLQRQFCAWVGTVPAGVLLSAVVFGAGHLYQGSKQAIVIAVYGVLFGILAEMRKSLRPGMMTHALHDTIIGLVARLVRP